MPSPTGVSGVGGEWKAMGDEAMGLTGRQKLCGDGQGDGKETRKFKFDLDRQVAACDEGLREQPLPRLPVSAGAPIRRVMFKFMSVSSRSSISVAWGTPVRVSFKGLRGSAGVS